MTTSNKAERAAERESWSSSAPIESNEWPDPEPLPDDLPGVMPFDDELLPATCRPWVVDIAERLQCPPDFPASAAMIALGVHDKHDADGIPFVRFSPSAQDRFDDWRGTLERRLRFDELTPCLEAHLAKYRSLIPSLALLTHLAERSDGGVGLPALDRAIRWAEYLETHVRRIYGHAVQSDVAAAKLLLAKLRKGALHDGFTARDVYRPQWSGLTERQAVEDALAVLVDHGYLRTHEQRTGGKPLVTFTINPKCAQVARPRTDKADIGPPRPVIVSNGSDRPAPFPKHAAPETSDEWGDVA